MARPAWITVEVDEADAALKHHLRWPDGLDPQRLFCTGSSAKGRRRVVYDGTPEQAAKVEQLISGAAKDGALEKARLQMALTAKRADVKARLLEQMVEQDTEVIALAERVAALEAKLEALKA